MNLAELGREIVSHIPYKIIIVGKASAGYFLVYGDQAACVPNVRS